MENERTSTLCQHKSSLTGEWRKTEKTLNWQGTDRQTRLEREREEEKEVMITVRTIKSVCGAQKQVLHDVNQVYSTGTSGHK